MRSKKTKACPLASRIKRMMQKDDDVGKIASASPILIARATELFLQQLCERAAVVAKSRNAKTVSVSHLKSCVASVDTLDFLQETVRSAPDLGADEEGDKPKRRRAATADHEEGQATPKPRARSRSTANTANTVAAVEADRPMGASPHAQLDSFIAIGAGATGAYGDAEDEFADDGGGGMQARPSNAVSLRPSNSLGFSKRAAGPKQSAGAAQQDGSKPRPRKVAKRAAAGDAAGAVKEDDSVPLPAEPSEHMEAVAAALGPGGGDDAGAMAAGILSASGAGTMDLPQGALVAGLVPTGLMPAGLAPFHMQANNDYDDDYDA